MIKFYLRFVRKILLVTLGTSATAMADAPVQPAVQPWSQVPNMQTTPEVSNSLWFAQDCLGAMALHRAGEVSALQRAIADADKLLVMQTRDAAGRRGWPYVQELTPAAMKCGVAGSIDAFGDGTCNPPETPYMIQTGYAVACLAQVAQATSNTRYLDAATAAIEDSWTLGTDNATCPGSHEYLYSYHANDAGRFVRNTNAIMGVGLIRLYEATGIAKYSERALAIAKAEACEIAAGNLGYFGMADPRYLAAPQRESRRIENHIPHQVKFLQLVAYIFKQPGAEQNAHDLLDAFLTCTEPHCRPNNCAAWAVPAECRSSQNIAPCIEPNTSQWKEACAQARARFPRLSGFQLYLLEPIAAK